MSSPAFFDAGLGPLSHEHSAATHSAGGRGGLGEDDLDRRAAPGRESFRRATKPSAAGLEKT